MFVFQLVLACAPPPAGGGDSGSDPNAAPIATAEGTAPEGPWSDIDPYVTFGEGESLPLMGVLTGDFDGDGLQDIGLSSTGGTDFWFGPIGPGVLVTGAAATRFTDIWCDLNAGDLDGDGADDLQCEQYLSRAPARGVVTTAEAAAIAWLPSSIPEIAFGDIDGDGARDIVYYSTPPYVRIQYGPLVGALDWAPDVVPADQGWLAYDPGCSGYTLDVLPDVDGDGSLEVRAGKRYYEPYDQDCFPNPHHVWSPGDIRGRTLTTADALLTGLPESVLGPDVDGDGTRDLITEIDRRSDVYSLGDAIRSGTLGAPIRSTQYGNVLTGSSPGDLTGDGKAEILGIEQSEAPFFAIVPSETEGVEVDVAVDGVLWDAQAEKPMTTADVTGDGVDDVIVGVGPGTGKRVLDGASLRAVAP